MSELININEVPAIDPESDVRILEEITSAAIPLINRHIDPKRFKDSEHRDEFPTVTTYMGDNGDLWTPAKMVPWSIGDNFPTGYTWTPEDSPLPDAARSSLLIGLLTEDNLPWYADTIKRRFGTNEALNFWNRLWTAEEDRHSEVMRDYMTVGRLVDPDVLDRERMRQIMGADVPEPPSAAEALVYVAIQELATRISHQNTGRLIADTEVPDERVIELNSGGTALASADPVMIRELEPEQRASYIRQVGRAIMTRVAGDENKHHVFYRDVVDSALQIDPSTIVRAIEMQVRGFQMPGTGITDFWKHAKTIANAGVYDLAIHHDQILAPLLRRWKIESLTGLSDEAERARERTFEFMGSLGNLAVRFTEKREAKRASLTDDPDIIWVGKKPV